MLMTIVADDLTGACDTGALFTGRGRVGVFVAPAAPGHEWETAVVDTLTRARDVAGARQGVRETADRIAPRLGAGRLFKKIDSTMRGHVGAEIDALMEMGRAESAVVCPAFPEQGRRVVDGLLTVDGRPAHETATGRDPAYPAPTSRVAELLAAGTARAVVHLSLDEIRRAGPELVRVLKRAPGGLIVPDAESPGDLDALARAALHHRRFLLAGSAGLARAVSALCGASPRPAALPAGRGWLIVAGSLHPATRAQVDALVAAGVPEVRAGDDGAAAAAIEAGRPAVLTPNRPGRAPSAAARLATAEALAQTAAAVLARRRPDLVAVAGGETLHALFRALEARRLELTGAPAPGLALGDLVSDASPPLTVLTKAGGFGSRDLWVRLLDLGPARPGAGS